MNMKKITLALAGVVATVAFAPEASALPVFARQVGMACSACHFQHFPLLNAFGRAFKASGFTMGGAQANIEGEGLSIPATLNAAILTSMGYEKTNATKGFGAAAAVAPNVPGTAGYDATKPSTLGSAASGPIGSLNMSAGGSSTGGFYVAGESGEASLFVGGRGSDFMGYLSEITMGNGAAAVDSFKTPILFDFNGTRAGVVLFTTNGQGASYGFETLNTGANAIHSITNTVGFQNQYENAVSAQQYINTGAHATGASIVAVNGDGFINITKFTQAGPDHSAAAGSPIFTALSSTYLRLAGTFDLAGWDSAVGVQSWSGTSMDGTTAESQTKAWAVDGQAQGTLGDKPVGVYVTYAKAPAENGAVGNSYNPGTFDRSSFNVAAEIGVIPEKATLAAAVRLGKSGFADNNNSNGKDNAIYLTGTYKLAQNLLGRLSYVAQSGSYWDTTTATGTNATDIGKTSYTLNLYALF